MVGDNFSSVSPCPDNKHSLHGLLGLAVNMSKQT